MKYNWRSENCSELQEILNQIAKGNLESKYKKLLENRLRTKEQISNVAKHHDIVYMYPLKKLVFQHQKEKLDSIKGDTYIFIPNKRFWTSKNNKSSQTIYLKKKFL